MSSNFPPRPPSSSAALPRQMQHPSVETDFWATLLLDLNVRVEWLAQALEAIPHDIASASAVVRLHSYTRALKELHQAVVHVHADRSNPKLKSLFTLEGPLAGYLSRLYSWCDEVGDDFERMAVALRRREATSIVFSHHAVNQSYAQFNALIAAMRKWTDAARSKHDEATWRPFEEHVEELIWATEWVHMTLARSPGD